MQLYLITVSLVVLADLITGQIPFFTNQSQPVNQPLQPTGNAALPPPPAGSTDHHLVGNLSEPFTFQVAPPSIKVSYLGLNGYSLYIMGVGFSNKSKFDYDEKTNRLTVLSLDSTTVGYYSAVDANWKTFTTVLSAINVSSLTIHNSHVSEDSVGTALISCSVSIIRSTFKSSESATSTGMEYLPRLELSLSTRMSDSLLSNNKLFNDSLREQNLTRTITLQRPLTRADHNATVQCQVESTNNVDVYVIKTRPIDIEYGPDLETGALPSVVLDTEVMKMIAMDCQIEANPVPSYVWYEMPSNTSNAMSSSDYTQQVPLAGQTVFGTTRQIQRIYQQPGQYAMQCQAQSRGKTIKQDFSITIRASSNAMRTSADMNADREKSNKWPIIIGIVIASILLLLVLAIVVAAIVFVKRRKSNTDEKPSNGAEKPPHDRQGKSRWGGLPIDYAKYKHESLKADSSSTSHLVESAETNSLQAPPIPARPSPMTSANSSYRQAPSTAVSVSYRQASALPGFRSSASTRPYSPTEEDADEVSASINPMPLTNNRSRTNTPFGSHKSLSESIQSLRSNQQPALSLPMKKRPQDALPKREHRASPVDSKKDYQHHHYHNPAELRAEQAVVKNGDNTSSEGDDFETQQTNHTSEGSAIPGSSTVGYNQVDFSHQNGRRLVPAPPVPQKVVVHHDEVPPPYQQLSSKASPAHAYAYQEPTEV